MALGNPGLVSAAMHRVVASWWGAGLILGRMRGNDVGSGTLGSLLALPMALLLGLLGWQWQLAGAIAVTLLSLWAARPFVADESDPGWVCVDEAAGTFVSVIGLAPVPGALIGWAVFRLADIFKRAAPGVAAAEERLAGAVGLTADDVVAGLYGLAVGHLAQAIL